jgi:type I restriction enzyme S subunit
MTITLKRLGDIATYVNGYAFKPTDWKNKGLPIIRIQNLTNPDSPFNYYQGEIDDKYIVNKGDILISWSASLGVFEWLGEKAVLNQHIFKVIFDKEDIDKSYFKYIVQRSLERALKYLHGSTMKHITKKYFDNILVPIPDLVTQKKIAKVLDKAQELIDKRKAQIEALDQLTQSVFLEMFGNLKGEKVPLSELCDVNPSKKEIENIDKELPVTFLPMANVSENGELDLSESRLIKEVFDGFTYFREGDVLFAKITPCMENGKGAIARNLINNIGFGSTEFHVLRPKENVNSTWLYYLTSLQSFRKQAEANMTGSAGQKRVPKQFFSKYKVVLPPIELQNQFAEIVHKIQSQKEIMKKSLEELENNFNSLMQRAFKGELLND